MLLLRTLIASFILVRSETTSADPSWTEALIESAPVYLKANPGKAAKHVDAALYASQRTGVKPEILLGIAYVESRYFSHVVSRMECVAEECHRVGGFWRAPGKPVRFKGPYFCGALQVGGHVSWRRCQTLISDLRLNYLAAAQHLQVWLAQPVCARRKTEEARLHCALTGYNSGFRIIRRRRSLYSQRCLRGAQKILRNTQRIAYTSRNSTP